MYIPYNDSKFALRGKYSKVFSCFENSDDNGEKSKGDKEEEAQEQGNVKIYKIKYTINVLPGLIASSESNDETSFMELLSETEDHEIFECKIIKDLFAFSWDAYGYSVHYLGAFIHFAYIITFSMHINDIYMYRNYERRA